MGYTTQFKGTFKLNKPLTDELSRKLIEFSDTRHCRKDDYNEVEPGLPGLWCQWIPNRNNTGIEWDGGEKFYDYIEWLQYIIDNFLEPEGYEITEDSKVSYRGEKFEDVGYIYVKNGKVIKERINL